MIKANEAHINLLARNDLDIDTLKNSINKADQELQREKIALRKFQKSIIAVQKCILNETDLESALADQLSLYIGLNSEINIIKSLELFQNSINEQSRLRSQKSESIFSLFCKPLDELLKNDLKNQEGLKRDWHNSLVDYEQKLKRIKKGVDVRTDLDDEKRILKRTATDYFIKRNKAEKARGSDLTQSIAKFAQQQVDYHKGALRIAESLESKLRIYQSNNNATAKEQTEFGNRLLELRSQLEDVHQDSLQNSYNLHQISGGEEHGNTIRGQIFIKRTFAGIRTAYKKKFGVVKPDGFLYIYRNKSQNEHELKINLLTSSIRQNDKKLFELTTTERNKPFILMAENEGLTTKWVSVIANARQNQLTKIFEDEKLTKENRSESQTALNDLTASVISEIQKLPGNNFCADCRRINPTWLSVNLGILVCLDCSGKHRNLGVNYSKIQSLTLDKMGTANLLVARKMGNELFNEAYEGIDPGHDKPVPDSPIEIKHTFITRKYVDKAYVQRTAYAKDLAKDLAAAIVDSDMHSIVQAYAEGARPEAIIDPKMRTSCLHLAIGHPSLHVMEFLLQNSLDESSDKVDYVGPTDVHGNTILHKALQQSLPTDYIRLITRKYPKAIYKQNAKGDTPMPSQRNDAVTEVLNQAKSGSLPKLLHVDANWELNPLKELEPPSDDDLIDDTLDSSKLGRDMSLSSPNRTQPYIEEMSTDPNILDISCQSTHDRTQSLTNYFTEEGSTSPVPSTKYQKSMNQKINPNFQAELKNVIKNPLRPVAGRHRSTPSPTLITNPTDNLSYTPPTPQLSQKINEKFDEIKYRDKDHRRSGRTSSLHEKKKDYTVKENQLFRPTSNGTSNSGAFGKPPISGGSGAGTRETPKPLPRTIQTTPIGQENSPETPSKPLEIAIHSENQLLEFEERGNKRNSTPISREIISHPNMGNNLPSRSESFSKYTFGTSNPSSLSNLQAYKASENEYSTPVSRTSSNVSEKSKTEKKSCSIERTSSKKETDKRKSPELLKLPSRVEALYDCDGDEDDELTFVTGEIIQVTGQEDDDWWIGNIESQPHRNGCFPVIFVRSLDGAGARQKK